jgi:hypothetical protein
MTHPRSLIRTAFVTRLLNGTPAGERVHAGRLMPIGDQEEDPTLPAIVVHTRDREELLTRSPSGWNGFEERLCIVSVVCVAQAFDDIDTLLDDMAQAVEERLQAWTIPGFESSDAHLIDTRSDDPEFNGSLTTGATVLRYGVKYRTPFRDVPDPYTQDDPDSIYQSGAYPGGRVTPSGNTGTACPIGNANLFSNEEPIN